VQIITRTLSLLKHRFSEIILAGWPPDDSAPEGTITVADNFPGMGPLAGIEAAMKVSSATWLFVFGGDMPWLSEEIITDQATALQKAPADVMIPRIDKSIEPLHAIYRCSLHPYLESYLRADNDPAVRAFFRPLKVRYYDLPRNEKNLKAFTNINSPEDLHTGKEG
jgi:molybdopterin-guanine dinucleotide biosynthesis protein A